MQSQQICAAAPTGGIHALVAYNRETMSRNPISDQNAPRLPALFNAIVESNQFVVIDICGILLEEYRNKLSVLIKFAIA